MKAYENANFITTVLKGAATAVIVSLIGVLAFAFIVKTAMLSAAIIKTVNQFIKIISIFLGCSFNVRGKGGLIKGALIGATASVLTCSIFTLVVGGNFLGVIFSDLLFGAIIGAISGVICVNLSK